MNINYILSIFVFSIILGTKGYSQNKAEAVPKFTKEMRDKSWYENQAKLWEEEIKISPSNESSWLNLFTAYRSICIYENFSSDVKAKVDDVLIRMEKAIPGTYTFNYTKAWHLGCWDPESMKYAEKAYELQPENPAIYNELTVRYEIAMNLEKRKEFHLKMYEKNVLSPALLNYNYNVLASLEKNAILFTIGDNDTYPIWILQDALGFRTDVTIINISLAGINEYRNKLFKKAGIVQDQTKASDLDHKLAFKGEERKIWEKLLLKTVAENSSGKPVYIGLTVGNSESFGPIKDKLYLTGLALKYSEEKIDNISLIRKNYEKTFLMDYTKVVFQNDPGQNIINLCNQNYIAPFILLYKHYQITEEYQKADELKQLLIKFSKESNRENEVLQLIK